MSISALRLRAPLLFSALLCAGLAHAATQAAAPAEQAAPFDELTAEQWKAQAADLLNQAKASPSGMASVTLKKYPGHFTMLTVRTRSGGAEQHDHAADIFIVLDGEATEVTGGSIENASTAKPGETRGTRVVGGTEHRMQTGDIVHIAPGTPHQTLVAPGKTFTYYVIKVDQ
ncbi:cupin domain-containing protein [Silvibacterium dinghuense]|uniref:Cupin domain-containing protein n=1 Tax=Silvibacterium dinghuense TaxID=1560006 RepID=A0A4Q1SK38_9BACT|nr:hypothetical protein [Silvibacterium dinghuense]RXS97650.1 hypothetical protein ESZ00_07175 [Silvibacterium dinghuense]GGH00835.1 hypothetical protein GCM10011586_15570 [Silvibacterium dinghuense]